MKTKEEKVNIHVEGMSCANCAKGLEQHLERKGIKGISVNFSTSQASYISNKNINEKEVKSIIKQLGYTIKEGNKETLLSTEEKLFYFCLIFTVPLFSHMFLSKENILHTPLIQFILCVPVYIAGTLYFGKSALKSLKIGLPNMNMLIFMGSSAAFIYSIYGWIISESTKDAHQYLFFETSSTVITLVLLGNVLEKRSVKKTTTAISELSEIQKVIAKKESNNQIIEVDFDEIKRDDILIVNNGDKVPTDGIIINGNCLVDESMITGESIPINKSINDEVIGGTIITDGTIKIKATRTGENTLLSQIIELVKDSQIKKPEIQKIGDKISSIFVPSVLIISVLTYFFSGYLIEYFNIEELAISNPLLRAIAVLVISCPCAMGLATPTAVMVGIGRAARNGILIKGGDTLEKLASIKNLVFDKTGTLTTGKFIISELNILNGDEDTIKNIIYNLEKRSSHPIAKSLCKILKEYESPIEVKDFKEKKGVSVSAKINGETYKLGSSKIIDKKSDNDLFLLKNEELIATINIIDELKENTEDVFNKLKDYQITLLSGDKKEKCNIIASKLNINSVFSEKLPQEKIKIIESFLQENKTAMIGDGINDAAALEKSTVGISLANATGIAINSSDVILLKNKDLTQLPYALQIGKHTLLTIKQNLFWAFSYNIVAIPIAMMGLLNPMWAALFMAFSDIIVIGNSIRLRFKKIF